MPAAAVRDTTTAQYFADRLGSATRPLNSVLDLTKAAVAGIELPAWPQRLTEYVEKELSA